jgi:hypothetical protein
MKKAIFLTVIISFLFACNKKDDPQPSSNNGGTNTPPITTTNTPPNVSATTSSSTNPTTITINATDTDGTISKVEVFNGSTLLTTLTTSPYVYTLPTLANGSYTYTVKATDNSNAVTSTDISFTVSVTTPKQVTENIISHFIGTLNATYNSTLQFEGSTLTISSNGTLATNSAQSMFFGDGVTVANGTYTIDTQGNFIVKTGNYSTAYTVTEPSTGVLRLYLPNQDFFEFSK